MNLLLPPSVDPSEQKLPSSASDKTMGRSQHHHAMRYCGQDNNQSRAPEKLKSLNLKPNCSKWLRSTYISFIKHDPVLVTVNAFLLGLIDKPGWKPSKINKDYLMTAHLSHHQQVYATCLASVESITGYHAILIFFKHSDPCSDPKILDRGDVDASANHGTTLGECQDAAFSEGITMLSR